MYYSSDRNLLSFNYKFVHTPILIEWVDAVIPVDSISINEVQKKYLKITSPSSSLPGSKQSLKSTTTFIIPNSGVMKFKLLPSDLYSPQGIYTVEILEGKNKVLLETQRWIVPYPLGVIESIVTHSSDGRNSLGQIPVYEIIHIRRPGEYKIVDQQIIWLTDPPEEGETYSVVYQPAITLDQLKVHRLV